MIPKKIQPYFKKIYQTKDGANNLIEGMLICCNAHEFEVFITGTIKYGIFSKMRLFSENDKTAIEVRCKKCGKTISVFDSSCDGYDQCGKEQPRHSKTKRIACNKCQDESFSISIKYEYPSIQELEELETIEKDNAFTWIWITLECNNCGTRHKNFVDYETA